MKDLLALHGRIALRPAPDIALLSTSLNIRSSFLDRQLVVVAADEGEDDEG
jgi:hypothetical protein